MSCPCGQPVEQPWRTRDAIWSPASFIAGLIIIGVATLAIVGIRPQIGWIILAVLAAGIVASAVVQATRGHRGWCLTRRAVWYGLAIPGLPVRVVLSLGA